MTLLWTVLIGVAVGAHTSTWGMYKDAPHEGFTLPKYLRSLLLAAVIAPLVARVFGIAPTDAASAVILFGCIYAMERASLEAWKTFFRAEDQSKYAIPMQLAVFGRMVESRGARACFGALYLGAIVGGLALLSSYHPAPGTSPLFLALTIGALGGWSSAFGGAWKDAPIEGFQLLKFFRSPLLAAGFAYLLFRLGATPAQGTVGAIGYTVATTETYKTFFFPSQPRGKFAGKPVRFPEWLERRKRFVPLYVAVWGLVLLGFGLALAGRATSPRLPGGRSRSGAAAGAAARAATPARA
ncbi:MAG TPA: hypothetical protein VGP61_01865 [Gemmatimonadales bacterium]|nr:hypothetical protein [Gemmatimonadales bacterium]